MHPAFADRFPVAPHDVGPLHRPEARKLVAFQQGVDEFRALVRFGRVEELGGFRWRGRYANQVEVGATEEHRIISLARGDELEPAVLLEDVRVDLVAGRRRRRHVIRVGPDVGQRRGRDPLQVTHQDDGLGRPAEFDQSPLRDRGIGLVARAKDSEIGDVSHRAIVEAGTDRQLLPWVRRLQVPSRGQDIEIDRPFHRWRGTAPLRDPVAQEAVGRLVLLEPAPSLMRHASGGLLQDQAFGRIKDIRAPPERLARQSHVVELGVKPPEAQAEASFPLGRSVAGTLVAAAAPERRDHLRPEINRWPISANARKRKHADHAAHRQHGNGGSVRPIRPHVRPPFGATTMTSIGLPVTGSSNFETRAEPASATR